VAAENKNRATNLTFSFMALTFLEPNPGGKSTVIHRAG
jgi:hypothetical protein